MPGNDNRPVGWPQAHLRRGMKAFSDIIRISSDSAVIVRAIAEALIRYEQDLAEFNEAQTPQKSNFQARRRVEEARAEIHAEEVDRG
jgi:hypothetical protein